MLSTDDGYRALRSGSGLVALDRDVVAVSGPDAATFLQGQLSQDVQGLAAGAGAPSFLLEPTGKVGVWLHVTKVADDSFLLDVDAGFGEQVVARLQRFKLRTKADIEPAPAWHVVVWPDPPDRWTGFVDAGDGEVHTTRAPGAMRFVTTAPALGVSSLDDVDAAAFDAWRIERGLPLMGAELVTGETIPAEAGQPVIDTSVSFTKGCFTGQELVARIDSRGGKVPRQVRGLVITGARDQAPPVGAEVVVDDAVVGAITSVAWSPGFEAHVALASIARAVSPPADAAVRVDGESWPARLEALPLDPTA